MRDYGNLLGGLGGTTIGTSNGVRRHYGQERKNY
jgi:hypothetical protein